jgi:hypothetical protein
MKRFAALILALALFATPAVAMADWGGPTLEQIFDQYVETILFSE